MYIRVQSHPALGESVGPFEGSFIGSLLGNDEIFLFLNDRLGGGRHQVTYRTEDPPGGLPRALLKFSGGSIDILRDVLR